MLLKQKEKKLNSCIMNNHRIICQNNFMIIFLIILLIVVFILISEIKFNINFTVVNHRYNYKIDVIWFIKLKTFFRENAKLIQTKKKNSRKEKEYIARIPEILKKFEYDKFNLKVKIGLGSLFRDYICGSCYCYNYFSFYKYAL